MRKIMFDDHYGLETAVLNGTKTMTRRLAYNKPMTHNMHLGWDESKHLNILDGWMCVAVSQYAFGEIVAIAQSYKNAGYDEDVKVRCKGQWHTIGFTAGWENKMFVRADEMPHQIQITNIKAERLQDISDEDCIKEGVVPNFGHTFIVTGIMENQGCNNKVFDTPYEAFKALIIKMYGKKVWIDNPFVFAYTFKLIK